MKQVVLMPVALPILMAVLALASAANPAAGESNGSIVLFNGKDLSGWTDPQGKAPGGSWVVADGVMRLDKSKGGQWIDIWTERRFGDFVLDLEFKTEGNSGIFVRTDKPAECVQTGIEIQVERPAKKPGRHTMGAFYGCLGPSKDPTKAGQWNSAVITCQKNRLSVVLNGEKVLDADLDKWSEPGKNPDGTPNKFRAALKDFKREGHIGLQDHGANVSYRNIRLKLL